MSPVRFDDAMNRLNNEGFQTLLSSLFDNQVQSATTVRPSVHRLTMSASRLASWLASLILFHTCVADRTYQSRPDLAPPHLNVTIPTSADVEHGYLFIAPYGELDGGTPQSGPYIVDNSGELVWSGYGYFNPTVANFQPARWKGQHVLFGYEGTLNRFRGHGHGHHKIIDQHYQTIREVRSGGHYLSDLHEFNIVDEKTVLVGSYTPREVDLTPYGGDADQTWILEYVLQELDIETGGIVFEWHSLDHTSPSGQTLLPDLRKFLILTP